MITIYKYMVKTSSLISDQKFFFLRLATMVHSCKQLTKRMWKSKPMVKALILLLKPILNCKFK